MTLDQLNYLLVLAEEQNVTRAAQRLFITQPTLTTFINKLERELGTKLFDRTRTPVRPTKNGELYIRKMQELLLAEQQLKTELKYRDSGRERIRVGLGYAHSAMWSARLAEALFAKHAELDVRICEGQEADMMAALREGDIDIFFGHTEIDTVNFHFEVLFDERLLLLLPRCFLDSVPEENTPHQPLVVDAGLLDGKRMIVPGNSMGLNLNAQLMWKRYRFQPVATIQTNNMVAGIKMVSMGLGYMLGNEELAQFIAPEMRDAIAYCTLPDMALSRKYYYGYAENNPEQALIQETIRIMKEIVSPE